MFSTKTAVNIMFSTCPHFPRYLVFRFLWEKVLQEVYTHFVYN